MNQSNRKNSFLLYSQILALGLMLVFSPCSVRNSIQELLDLEKTDVNNKSKSTNNTEYSCSGLTIDIAGDYPVEFINTKPHIPIIGLTQDYHFQITWTASKDLSISQYEAPFTVKDKRPLYLLHQKFKSYLLLA